jgi:hypothetical protein
MWKANGRTTTLQLFLDSLSPKTEKVSLEGTMDMSRDRLILELAHRKTLHQTNNKQLAYLIHNAMCTTYCKGEEKIQTLSIVFSFVEQCFGNWTFLISGIREERFVLNWACYKEPVYSNHWTSN